MPLNHRIVIDQPGGPEQLRLRQEPVPVPQPHEALVRVRACGVAYGDVMFRRGASPGAPPFPLTPGYDLVGDVAAVGRAVTQVKPGDRVAALPGLSGYTTYICLPADELVPVPAQLPAAAAVSVVLNYTTAYRMLTRDARLKAGQSVLIHGAAGGVGTAVLQLAQVLGITAYGTASTGKLALVRAQGGIPIDYTKTDFVREIKRLTGTGVDAVLDPIGGPQLSRSYQALNGTGTLVMFGVSSTLQGPGNPKLKLLATLLRFGWLKMRPGRKRVVTSFLSSKKDRQAAQPDIAAMLQLLSEGKIHPLLAQVLPLAQAAEAHRLLEETRPAGKIVLEP